MDSQLYCELCEPRALCGAHGYALLGFPALRGEDTVVLRRGEATGEDSAPSGRSGKVGADCTPWRTHREAVPGVVVAPAVDAPVFAASLPPQHSCCPSPAE